MNFNIYKYSYYTFVSKVIFKIIRNIMYFKGIGKQFAIELIKNNMGVVLVARNLEKLESVK